MLLTSYKYIYISQFYPWKNIIHYSVEAGDKNETIEGEMKEEDNNDSSIEEGVR